MSVPVYDLSDLQSIERDAAARLSAIFEQPVTVEGPGADNPRTGASGTDVGGERQITARIGGEIVQHTYYSDNAAAYEHDTPRKDYAEHLAREIVRRYELAEAALEPDDAEDDGHVHVESEAA